MNRYTIFGTLALLVAGCSGDRNPTDSPKTDGPGGAAYLLSDAPAGVKCVLDERKDAKDGDEVVVVGRIGGSKEPMGKDRAYFTIVDPSLKDCRENGEEDCATPWDYT